MDAGTIFEAILLAGYGASSGKMLATYSKLKNSRERQCAVQKNYYTMLYKLRSEGLIFEKNSRTKKLLSLTAKGRHALRILKAREQKLIPHHHYQKEKSITFTIVAFDIPERERRKRSWLRAILTELGFQMAQKSVWIGKIKLPSAFIRDLANYRLVEYVHIFEITKFGTLSQISPR